MERISRPVYVLAWVACVFTFFLIAFGAFVRLSDAGLSCPDWPTCYGRITWPVKPAAIAKADRAFPHRPVETHRAWREQVHRFLAGTLGVLVLAEALAATWIRRRRFGLVILAVILVGIGIPLYMAHDYVSSSVVAGLGEVLLLAIALFWRGGGWRRVAVLALAVVCFQALLGMWTVTLLLLPIVVTAHLLGGLLTFALLAWLACWLSMRGAGARAGATVARSAAGSGEVSEDTASRRFEADAGFAGSRGRARWNGLMAVGVVGLALLSGQIFLGGWTSTNYAALACGVGGAAFPECLGHWWPAMNFHQGFVLLRHIGVDYQGGILDAAARTAIQMAHRIGALVVLVYLLGLAHRIGRAGMRWHGVALALAVIAQVLLGIAQVVLGLPLWVAVAHTAGAALLLFVLVALLVRSSVVTVSPSPSVDPGARVSKDPNGLSSPDFAPMRSSQIVASPHRSAGGAAPGTQAPQDQNDQPWPDFPQRPSPSGVE